MPVDCPCLFQPSLLCSLRICYKNFHPTLQSSSAPSSRKVAAASQPAFSRRDRRVSFHKAGRTETRTAPGSIAQMLCALNLHSTFFHDRQSSPYLPLHSTLGLFVFHGLVQPYRYFLKNRSVDVFSYFPHFCHKIHGKSNIRKDLFWLQFKDTISPLDQGRHDSRAWGKCFAAFTLGSREWQMLRHQWAFCLYSSQNSTWNAHNSDGLSHLRDSNVDDPSKNAQRLTWSLISAMPFRQVQGIVL